MKLISTTTRKEYLAYLILWIAIVLLPFLGSVINASTDETYHFHWNGVFHAWQWVLMLFVAFFIHNHLLAPMLVYRHHRKRYIASVLLLLGLFMTAHYFNIPEHHPSGQPPALTHQNTSAQQQIEIPPPPPEHQPPLVDVHDITMFTLLIFLLGTNLGIKYYYKTENDSLKLKSLEHANLKQELEYLKYQINPHFFMNTLNNIHALVDIDSEAAKKSIVDLSHMMRYVLYDGAQNAIPLDKGILFLKNYIAIMRLRYSDNVDIQVSLPEQTPQVEVPPLITIPFVENAFKHGVSYVKPSFIHISLDIDSDNGTVVFSCRNSKHQPDKTAENSEKQGGVGLTNVTKRLNLLYGDNYTLNIDNAGNIFSVRLILPFKANN